MFIFIDESGLTDVTTEQKYLVVAFALMRNRAFAEELIFGIKDKCKEIGKPIKRKEIKVAEETPPQAVGYASFGHYFPCWVAARSFSVIRKCAHIAAQRR